MEQTTQYLYEYRNGKRIRNIGFMKIEDQMDKCLIQIYAKNMDDIQGILFQKENGDKYIGGWEAQMLPVEEESNASQEAQTNAPQEPRLNAPQEPRLNAPQEPRLNTPQQPRMPAEQPTTSQDQPPAPNMPTVQKMAEPEEIDSYIPPSNVTYEKIQRQDISRFPRKEWRIANNSFLLHGYRNYHHLLYIEEGGKVWLGVPGIFHEKEQMAANAFGFPEFRRVTDTDIKLEETEKNTYEDFGYWCRQIPNA